MGCNCGKKSTLVRQGAQPEGTATRGRTRVMFHVLPPPEGDQSGELVFTNLYEARIALKSRDGWRVEPRREGIE